MIKRFRTFVRSSQSKDDLQNEQQPTNDKQKRKFLGIFRTSSDTNFEKNSQSPSLLKRNLKKDDKKFEIDERNGGLFDAEVSSLDVEKDDNSLSENSLDNGIQPTTYQTPNGLAKDDLRNNNISLIAVEPQSQNNNFEQNANASRSLESCPGLPTTPTEMAVDLLPPDDMAWARAKKLWEQGDEEEEAATKDNKKPLKKENVENPGKKGHREHRSKSRHDKDRKYTKERSSESKSKSRDRHGREEARHDEKYQRRHNDKKKETERKHNHKHKHRTDDSQDRNDGNIQHRDHKHKHKDDKHRTSTDDIRWDDGGNCNNTQHNKDHKHKRKHKDKVEDDGNRERNKDRDHKHKHKHSHRSKDKHDKDDNDYDGRHKHKDKSKDRHEQKYKGDSDYDQKHKHKHKDSDDSEYGQHRHKHERKHKDSHSYDEKPEKHYRHHRERYRHSDQKQEKPRKKHGDSHKKIELDKVWREYESGKRYYSMEKDMKKVIDRLDGVERYRREERQRSTDRSRGFSSDTSCEVTQRSRERSRERRSRRSRSREKEKLEAEKGTLQYSLGRIEARQEQCKADIDTARRSIEHRIRQLEARLEKQYSSSEKLPDKTTERLNDSEAREIKEMIDKVADECREVTKTLETRTEEMKTEITSVVREEFSNLDERLSFGHKSPESPISFYGMQPGDFTPKNSKLVDDVTTCLTSLSITANESVGPTVEGKDHGSLPSPVRVSQSGALDTLSEPAVFLNSDNLNDNGHSEPPDSPLTATSEAFENMYELSIQSLECDECEEDEGAYSIESSEALQNMHLYHCEEQERLTDSVASEALQNMYHVRIKETEERCPYSVCSPETLQNMYYIKIKGTEERCPYLVGPPETLQNMYHRKIKEADSEFQEKSAVEKEAMHERIDELETKLLTEKSYKDERTEMKDLNNL